MFLTGLLTSNVAAAVNASVSFNAKNQNLKMNFTSICNKIMN